jgi:hypothetical protein
VKFASYCGGCPQIVSLADNGSWKANTWPSADPSHDPLENIFINIPSVLEACAKGSLEDFQSCMDLVQADFKKVMYTRKKDQGVFRTPQAKEWIW